MKTNGILRFICLMLSLIFILSVAAGCSRGSKETATYYTIDDFAGKKVGAQMGTVFGEMLENRCPESKLQYYQNVSDLSEALKKGKIECFPCEETVAGALLQEVDGLTTLDQLLDVQEIAPIFPNTSKGKKLCEEFNDFLKELTDDGTLRDLQNIWFSEDESEKEMPKLTSYKSSGKLKVATSASNPPYEYVQNNETAGYEPAVLTLFANRYGYDIEYWNMDFDGVISSIASAKCDMAAACISVTEERQKNVSFTSVPICYEKTVIVVREENKGDLISSGKYDSIYDLDGETIAIVSGSIFASLVTEMNPNVKTEIYNTSADGVEAVLSGKATAFASDYPKLQVIKNKTQGLDVLDTLLNDDCYAMAFPKTEKGAALRDEINEFINKLSSDGTLRNLQKAWLGTDESLKVMTEDTTDGKSGKTITAAVCSEFEPFVYLRDGEIVGYEVDLMKRFANEYGYDLKFADMSFSGIVPGIASGKYDLAAGTISATEERAKSVYFSDPDYYGGGALLVRAEDKKTDPIDYSGNLTIDDLAGKTFGLLSGSVHDRSINERLAGITAEYFNSVSDLALALSEGKIDAYCSDDTAVKFLHGKYPDHKIFTESLGSSNYACIFSKSGDRARKLRDEINEFTAKCKKDGTIERLESIWVYNDTGRQKMTHEFSGKNGILEIAVSTQVGAPCVFESEGKYMGMDADFISLFCQEYGYEPHFTNYEFSEMMSAVTSGMADLAISGITVTNERKASMNFSDPYYTADQVVVFVPKAGASGAKVSFADSVRNSFTGTFITENRWRLFLNGIFMTLQITIAAVVLGTLLGFALFMLRRTGSAPAVKFTDFFTWFIHGIPTVVLLMILFYIVFVKTNLSGVVVAIIGFTLIFAEEFIGMLTSGVGAIDKGQTEAAWSLGYTDFQAFFKVVLPQAVRHFLPSYKGAVVSLIKATSVVGYIAVQDLTKISDIIRSRTYDAFFPLLATAAIYFALSGLLVGIVDRIEIRTDPKKRKPEDILKGVETR